MAKNIRTIPKPGRRKFIGMADQAVNSGDSNGKLQAFSKFADRTEQYVLANSPNMGEYHRQLLKSKIEGIKNFRF
ncbi:MAG TPA: hypothetical protein VJI52_02390 [Candidatus Nanoarchaeia archaeon]|nr:hypothetical protein [Candidatus Nanoarchaeia archaeon]